MLKEKVQKVIDGIGPIFRQTAVIYSLWMWVKTES